MRLLTGDMLTEPNNSRSLDRRRVYIGEGLSFQIESEAAWLEAEAIDLTHEGLGAARPAAASRSASHGSIRRASC